MPAKPKHAASRRDLKMPLTLADGQKDNPHVFLEFSADGKPLGRVEFELFANVCPRTAENFRVLCVGPHVPEKGKSKVPITNVYRGSIIHRATDFMVQGGDLSGREDGKGQESIYGPLFDDEGFSVPHDQAGVLSMANSGPNTNGSQFIITTCPAPWLDGRLVAFGRVRHGLDVLTQVHQRALASADPETGRPAGRIVVTDCGPAEARSPRSPGLNLPVTAG
eukprot:EG_transcript_23893